MEKLECTIEQLSLKTKTENGFKLQNDIVFEVFTGDLSNTLVSDAILLLNYLWRCFCAC